MRCSEARCRGGRVHPASATPGMVIGSWSRRWWRPRLLGTSVEMAADVQALLLGRAGGRGSVLRRARSKALRGERWGSRWRSTCSAADRTRRGRAGGRRRRAGRGSTGRGTAARMRACARARGGGPPVGVVGGGADDGSNFTLQLGRQHGEVKQNGPTTSSTVSKVQITTMPTGFDEQDRKV